MWLNRGRLASLPDYQKEVERPLRCATLVRVSTAEQATDGRAGLDRQLESNSRVVAAKNYNVCVDVMLVGVSGASMIYAPEVIDLIARIERKELDVIVCSEMSRLGRPDELTSFELLSACKRNGVSVDAGGTVIDLASPEGFLSGGLLSLIAGFDRMTILKRMMQSKEVRRAQGKNPQSDITLPMGIGYDRKADRYVYTPDIVKVIEAYRLVDEGLRNLTEVGRRAGGLSAATTKNVLRNPAYRGERVYDKCRDQSRKVIKKDGRQGDRPKIKRAPDKVIRVRIFPPDEQAVTDERWNRVQEVLRGIRENHEVFVAERFEGSLLAGTGRCGCCGIERLGFRRRGRKLAEKSPTKGHVICRSTLTPSKRKCPFGWQKAEAVEELIEAFVGRFLADPSFVEAVITNAKAKQAGKIVSLDFGDAINEKLADLEKRDRRIVDALVDGAISTAEAKERRARLEQERSFLVSSQEKSIGSSRNQGDLSGIARQIAEGVKGWPADGTTREKKAFLQRTFSELYVRPGPELTAFRISAGLLGPNLGNWSFIADIPVSLDPPVRLKEPEPEIVVPEGHHYCRTCSTTRPQADFYRGNKSCCRRCRNKANTKLKRRNRKRNADGADPGA